MTEPGGPTAQAGIDFQNRVAALYMGDLLNLDHQGVDRVVAVRVEAPAKVDDVVVTFADGRRRWVQAKLVLSDGGRPWSALWRNLKAQLEGPDFTPGDRLRLVLGESPELAHELRECAARTTSSMETEWRGRLSGPQRALVADIERILGAPCYTVFAALDVESLGEAAIGKAISMRMPLSSIEPNSLHSILQSTAATRARRRQEFSAPQLRDLLTNEHEIRLDPPSDWGLAVYLNAMASASIAVPGTSVGGRVAQVFHWPRTVKSLDGEPDFDDEHGFYGREPEQEEFDLKLFPTPQTSHCIVHAGPGFGKSALLIALADRAVEGGRYVPAILSLSALSDKKGEVIDFLEKQVNTEYSVRIGWTRLCETGAVLILFDGLDEVPVTDRANLVNALNRFSARFPNVPWVLTVRDPAVLPAGFDAEKLEIRPLSDEEMKSFAKSIQPGASGKAVERVIEQVTSYPDLERLVRIPLFLALLVATWTPGQPVPRRRTELIEAYLKTLFRPEEHKGVPRAADPELLRAAVQRLAYKLLELGDIGSDERSVRKLLASVATTTVGPEQLFDDALRCGVLKRSGGTRLTFPFPIVQEYLAGQELVDFYESEIQLRAELAAHRPWAQAVQFALEKIVDGTAVGEALMSKPDDAFATTARLVARCIVNGMRCSAELHDAVGERLASSWHRQSYWTARRMGQLIDDEWSSPPGQAVREALHRRSVLHDGAAEILARLKDAELTYSVLGNYLRSPQYVAHLGAFQIAVNRISGRAFELYLGALRSGAYGDEVWAAASLVSRLSPAGIERSALHSAASDESLPTNVRLAV